MEFKPLKVDKTELLTILTDEQINTIAILLANFDEITLIKTGAIDILNVLESTTIQSKSKVSS